MIYVLEIWINKLDIPILDNLLSISLIGPILTIFAVTGLANAYNIIDNFRCLSSMVYVITWLAITYAEFLVDLVIVYLSLIMASSILGFFV